MFQYELLLVKPDMVVKQLSQFLGLDIKYVDKRTDAAAEVVEPREDHGSGAVGGLREEERAGLRSGRGRGQSPTGTSGATIKDGASGKRSRKWMAMGLLVGGFVLLFTGAPCRVGALVTKSDSSKRVSVLFAVSVVLWLLLILAVRSSGGTDGSDGDQGRGTETGGRRLNFHGDERYATSRDYDVHISGVSSSDLEFIKVFQERALPLIMAGGSDPEYGFEAIEPRLNHFGYSLLHLTADPPDASPSKHDGGGENPFFTRGLGPLWQRGGSHGGWKSAQ